MTFKCAFIYNIKYIIFIIYINIIYIICIVITSRKVQIEINVATDEGNSRNEIEH